MKRYPGHLPYRDWKAIQRRRRMARRLKLWTRGTDTQRSGDG